jgi:hypothetical protein
MARVDRQLQRRLDVPRPSGSSTHPILESFVAKTGRRREKINRMVFILDVLSDQYDENAMRVDFLKLSFPSL